MKIYTNADDLPKDIVEYIKSWSIMEWSALPENTKLIVVSHRTDD